MKNTAEIKKNPPSFRSEHWLHLFSEGISILTFIVGAAVLVGWAFDIEFLKSVFPGLVTMKANTAFCFMLAGVGLWFSQSERANTRLFRVISRVCFFIVAFVGLLTLSEYLFGWNLGIDQLLFKEPAGDIHTVNIGRMAPDTAICFVLFAVGSWIVYDMSRNRRLILIAGLISSLMLIIFALPAILLYSLLGFVLLGWWNLTPMALHTAIIFLVLGVVIILKTLRRGFAPRVSQFSKNLLVSGVLVIILTVVFFLYIQSRQQENYAQLLRFQSFRLVDELRQSSDDLTRMVRTYAVTGDPVYKQYYQDILDIRNGKKSRPEEYWRVYWDLVLSGSPVPRPESRQSISLLKLIQQVGFTKDEFRKLVKANANSDRLTTPEFEAMKLVESLGPESGANRHKAIQMLYDKEYHEAKYGIMKPIDECFEMVDRRTLATVKNVNYRSMILKWMFIVFGLGLILVLFRTYAALRETLGDSLDNVHAQIRKIGSGDFSSPIEMKDLKKNSVLGWLLQTQTKLRAYSDERQKAQEGLARQAIDLNISLKEALKSREILKSMLDDNNQVRGSLEERIAELKRAQNMLLQSEKLASLGRLAADIAHEINNPLMIIFGNAQLSLMIESVNAEVKNNLQIIMEESQKAKTIMQRLLRFSKPSKGQVCDVNINHSIESVISLQGKQLESANIEIKREHGNNLAAISIDEQLMQEVFVNLINNAKEAMPKGGAITIKTSLDGDYLRIDFKDTGPGMSEAAIKRLFEPFFTTKEQGTGLGLSICYGIVKAHNGELRVESQLNQGTVATIMLPRGGGNKII